MLTLETNSKSKMKVLYKYTATLLIGASLITVIPARAFWERKISWDILLEGKLTSKEQRRIYDERGWTFHKKINAQVWYSKLFDCRGNECIYFTKVIEDPDKNVAPQLHNCHSGYSEALEYTIKGFRAKDPEAQRKYC